MIYERRRSVDGELEAFWKVMEMYVKVHRKQFTVKCRVFGIAWLRSFRLNTLSGRHTPFVFCPMIPSVAAMDIFYPVDKECGFFEGISAATNAFSTSGVHTGGATR